MRALSLIAAALALSTVPAIADMHELGSVNVAADHYTHVTWDGFDGPAERLRLTADNDTVDCEHVIVNYRDGVSHNVFSGLIPREGAETITFVEGDRRIRDIDFACKAENRDGARIAISAVSQDPYEDADIGHGDLYVTD